MLWKKDLKDSQMYGCSSKWTYTKINVNLWCMLMKNKSINFQMKSILFGQWVSVTYSYSIQLLRCANISKLFIRKKWPTLQYLVCGYWIIKLWHMLLHISDLHVILQTKCWSVWWLETHGGNAKDKTKLMRDKKEQIMISVRKEIKTMF